MADSTQTPEISQLLFILMGTINAKLQEPISHDNLHNSNKTLFKTCPFTLLSKAIMSRGIFMEACLQPMKSQHLSHYAYLLLHAAIFILMNTDLLNLDIEVANQTTGTLDTSLRRVIAR